MEGDFLQGLKYILGCFVNKKILDDIIIIDNSNQNINLQNVLSEGSINIFNQNIIGLWYFFNCVRPTTYIILCLLVTLLQWGFVKR